MLGEVDAGAVAGAGGSGEAIVEAAEREEEDPAHDPHLCLEVAEVHHRVPVQDERVRAHWIDVSAGSAVAAQAANSL